MLERVELEAVAKIIRTLNYYQILKVSNLATQDEIQEAFHQEALNFHPDQYAQCGDPEQIRLAKSIYSKVVEAYGVLSSRHKRQEYDNKLQGIDPIYEDDIDDEDSITSVKSRPQWANKNPGEKFFHLAEKAFSSGDVRSAYMNIQIAIGAEPTNPRYSKLKDKVTEALQNKR